MTRLVAAHAFERRQQLAQRRNARHATSSARRARPIPPASAGRACSCRPCRTRRRGVSDRPPPPPPPPPVPPPAPSRAAGATSGARRRPALPPPWAPPDAGGALGRPVDDRRAAGATPPKGSRDRPPHSRSPTLRSASRLRLAMSRASDRLPNSHASRRTLVPMTRCSASRTRSCAQVKLDVRADRQEHQRRAIGERERRRRIATPPARRAATLPGLERALIDDEHEQPAEAGPLVRADRGRRRPSAAVGASAGVVSTYSALTTRRGCPATVTVKSPAPGRAAAGPAGRRRRRRR